jgi:diguanylate cyclase (GGDEF)-like protein
MTILIAEDNPSASLILRKALQSLDEEVVIASDGEQAWQIIKDRQDVRIVLSDWMMPKIEGIELCRRVRKLVDRPYLYFILITAKTVRDDRLAGLEAGADDFVAKPVDCAELLARVKVARRLLAAQDEIRARSQELERLHNELRWQNAQLAELATSDGLTGLKNHRHFRGSLDPAVSFANRKGLPLSLIMLDIDDFKSYNDAFGHPAGDAVLIDVARTLRDAVREHDLVARYGGEEFVLLLPATDADAGLAIAERLRVDIARRPWPNRPIHASLGVATSGPSVATPARLVELADRALYMAKSLGRNRAIHADELGAAVEASDAARTIRFPGSGR